MFKRLKEKLVEEVKQSPSMIPSLGSSSSSSNLAAQDVTPPPIIKEDQFSITEDDGASSDLGSPVKKYNSDKDVRPKTVVEHYEPLLFSTSIFDNQPSTSYIPPSDLESEMDDSIQGSPTVLDESLSKEQLLHALQKFHARVQKYKAKYSKVTKSFKEANAEKEKVMRALSDNQDRALRRLSELREQCNLEQQAKAHLEENLRLIIDEKDNEISVLQTKVQLLKEGNYSNVEEKEGEKEDLFNKGQNAQDLQNKVNRLEELLTRCKAALQSNKERSVQLGVEKDELYSRLELKEQELLRTQEEESRTQARLQYDLERSQEALVLLQRQNEESSMAMAETKQSFHQELETREQKLSQAQKDLKEQQKENKSLSEQLAENQTITDKILEMHESTMKAKLKEKDDEIQKIKSDHSNVLDDMKVEHGLSLKLKEEEFTRKIVDLEQHCQEISTKVVELLEDTERKKALSDQQNDKLQEGKSLEYEKEISSLKSRLGEKEDVSFMKINALQNELDQYKKDSESVRNVLKKSCLYSNQDFNKLMNEQQLCAEKVIIETHLAALEENFSLVQEGISQCQLAQEFLLDKKAAVEEFLILKLKYLTVLEDKALIEKDFGLLSNSIYQAGWDNLGWKENTSFASVQELTENVFRDVEVFCKRLTELEKIHSEDCSKNQIAISLLNDTISDLEKELGSCKTELNFVKSQLANTNNQFQAQIAELEEEVKNKNNLIEEINLNSAKVETNKTETESKIQSDRKKISNLKKSLDDKNNQLEMTKIELTECKKLITRLQEDISEKEATADNLRCNYSSLEHTLNQQLQELSSCSDNIEHLKNMSLEKQKQIDSLVLSSLQLEEQLNGQIEDRNNLVLKITERENEKQVLDKELSELRNKVTPKLLSLETQFLESTKSINNQQNSEPLSETDLSIEETVERLQKYINNFVYFQSSNLENDSAMKKKLYELEKNLLECNEKVQLIESEKENLSQKCVYFEEKIEEKENAKLALTDELKLLSSELDKRDGIVIQLGLEINERNIQKSQLEVDCNEFKEELQKMKDAVIEKGNTISEMEENLKSTNHILEQLKISHVLKEAEIDQLNSIALENENKVASMNEKMIIIVSNEVQLQNQIKELNDRIKELDEDILKKFEELKLSENKINEASKLISNYIETESKLKVKIEELQKEISELLQRIKEEKSDHETALHISEENSTKLKETFSEKLESSESIILELKTKLETYETIKLDLEEQLKVKVKEVTAEAELEKTISSLNEELSDLRLREKNLLKEIEVVRGQLQESHEKHSAELDNFKASEMKLKSELSKRDIQLDESLLLAQVNTSSMSLKLEETLGQLESFKQLKENLERELDQLLSTKLEINPSENVEGKLKQLVRSFNQKLVEKDDEHEKAILEIKETSQKLEDKFIYEKEDVMRDLERQLEEQNAAIDEMRDEFLRQLQEKDEALATYSLGEKGKGGGDKSSDWDNGWDDDPDDQEVEHSKSHKMEELQTALKAQKKEIAELKEILHLSNNSNNYSIKTSEDYLEPTTFEYLRNILIEYMMGKEPMVLAKVIAAVLRFSHQQTVEILQREEARQASSV